jgi:PEP-CTERM motif
MRGTIQQGVIDMTISKKALIRCAAAASFAFAVTTPAYAILNVPVPTGSYITFGGNDWAWAAPCAPAAPSCGGVDFTYQATQGWRLPTAAEFLAGPTAANFGTSSNFACAAPYFSIAQQYCDYGDGVSFAIFGHPNNPFIGNGNVDTWVIRGVAGAVPEPATWGLMLVGFGIVGGAMRRRQRTSVSFA